MEGSLKCSKCDGLMEKGLRADLGHYNNVYPERWLPGMAPGMAKEAKLFGLKLAWLTVDLRNAKMVSTFCCSKCGYLESYAN